MIWDTVSSWSCLCWLYRVSPSLATKNIINLILVLTISWCPCVESYLSCVVGKGCLLWPVSFSINFYPASFCTPRPKLPVTPSVSCLPSFAFQYPIMKRTSFLGVTSRSSSTVLYFWITVCSWSLQKLFYLLLESSGKLE